MRNRFAGLVLLLSLVLVQNSCKKAAVGKTEACNLNTVDSSSKHPKNVVYRAIIEKYKKLGLPGIAVLIEDENGVWMGGAGKSDIDEQVDFKPCTVSKVASITKMMFAAAVMQLREQGKIDLDDKVSKWLDESIVKRVKNAEKATLRDLLQHSTGIYDIISDADFYLAALNNPNKKWKGTELIKFAYDKPVLFDYPDGKGKVGYSNTNTLLLSMCVEKITGKSHHLWMRELVIDKLGLSNTYYNHHDDLPKNTAQGYYDLYNNGTIVNVSNIMTGNGNAYGGIYSNVVDLYRFIRAMFIDKTLVNQQSLDMMQTFLFEDEKNNLGLGLIQQYQHLNLGQMGIGHSGRDLGYSGDAHYFPDRNNRIFINLVNYGTNGETKLRQVFYDMRDEFVTELMK